MAAKAKILAEIIGQCKPTILRARYVLYDLNNLSAETFKHAKG